MGFFFLPWVVAATMVVVVVANGGCFGFFAVGCGCYGGASDGSSLWVFGSPICFFFFFFPPMVVADYKGWWQWMWVMIKVMAIM